VKTMLLCREKNHKATKFAVLVLHLGNTDAKSLTIHLESL
jgi:hypothetical protein